MGSPMGHCTLAPSQSKFRVGCVCLFLESPQLHSLSLGDELTSFLFKDRLHAVLQADLEL